MKELRFNGNFMGFEGSECVEVHTDYDAPLTDCQSCVEPCAVDHPCHGCFAAWRAENERYRKALEIIAADTNLYDIGYSYPSHLARMALEEEDLEARRDVITEVFIAREIVRIKAERALEDDRS